MIALTSLFAVAMISVGLERSIFAPIRQSTTHSKAQVKFNNLIRAHLAESKTELTAKEIEQYKHQAVQIAQNQAKIESFLSKNHFQVSTKQLIKLAEQEPQFKPLLAKLEAMDPTSRKEIPQQLQEIKTYVEQKIFESSILNSSISTESSKEHLRSVFMQERTYEWLVIDKSYLQDAITDVENEAEIHEYYDRNDFPTLPSAKISFIELSKKQAKTPQMSMQELRAAVDSNAIAPVMKQTFDVTVYEISQSKTAHMLNQESLTIAENSSPLPEKYQEQPSIYYQKVMTQSLDAKQAKELRINHAKEGQYVYSQSNGKEKLVRLNSRKENKCLTIACLKTAKQKWIEQEQAKAINQQVTAIQEEKLYNPKNLSAVAKKLQLRIAHSDTFTPESKISSKLDSQILKNLIFSPQAEKIKTISSPLKLENGNVIIYQIQSLTPSTKKPLSDVRVKIVEHLHQQRISKKLAEDASLSIKQLHNGESIQTLEKKFKTRIKSTSANNGANKIPSQLLEAAKRIPSSNIGWTKPIIQYMPENDSWYLLSLSNVIHTDKYSSAVENIANDETITALLQHQELNTIYKEILT